MLPLKAERCKKEKAWSRPERTRVTPLRDGEGNDNEIKKEKEEKLLHNSRSELCDL